MKSYNFRNNSTERQLDIALAEIKHLHKIIEDLRPRYLCINNETDELDMLHEVPTIQLHEAVNCKYIKENGGYYRFLAKVNLDRGLCYQYFTQDTKILTKYDVIQLLDYNHKKLIAAFKEELLRR